MSTHPTVTILFVPGCPGWRLAVEHVTAALQQLGHTIDLVLLRVRDHADAARVGFTGSPTILIDGRDPFASGKEEVGMLQRSYPTPAGPRAAPTTEMLREILAETHGVSRLSAG